MKIVIASLVLMIPYCVLASYQDALKYIKPLRANQISEEQKIKSCLASLHYSQYQFRKNKGYFAPLPEQLNIKLLQSCDGVQVSTYLVTDNQFKMSAKLKEKAWTIDQSRIMKQLR